MSLIAVIFKGQQSRTQILQEENVAKPSSNFPGFLNCKWNVTHMQQHLYFSLTQTSFKYYTFVYTQHYSSVKVSRTQQKHCSKELLLSLHQVFHETRAHGESRCLLFLKSNGIFLLKEKKKNYNLQCLHFNSDSAGAVGFYSSIFKAGRSSEIS